MALLCLATLGGLSLGPNDPLSGWITHTAVKLVLAAGRELSRGCELGGLVPLHRGLRGHPFSTVTMFQQRASQGNKGGSARHLII